jgi:hypothetical protein
MKTFRVSISYVINGNAGYISTIVPAFHNDQAIEKVTQVNKLTGLVTASKAIEVK